MSFLRFLMFLGLIVWVGGLIFFMVVAGVSFSVLPSTHLAGLVVRESLIVLHWMGIASGIIFLAASIIYNRMVRGSLRVFSPNHVLIGLMLVLTFISQFGIIPRMDALRASVGDISSLPADNAILMQFDFLHVWSTRLEVTVLFLGLLLSFLVSRTFEKN